MDPAHNLNWIYTLSILMLLSLGPVFESIYSDIRSLILYAFLNAWWKLYVSLIPTFLMIFSEEKVPCGSLLSTFTVVLTSVFFALMYFQFESSFRVRNQFNFQFISLHHVTVLICGRTIFNIFTNSQNCLTKYFQHCYYKF